MEPRPLVHREELTGLLFTIADINVNVERIVSILEGDGDDEEAEEDS